MKPMENIPIADREYFSYLCSVTGLDPNWAAQNGYTVMKLEMHQTQIQQGYADQR